MTIPAQWPHKPMSIWGAVGNNHRVYTIFYSVLIIMSSEGKKRSSLGEIAVVLFFTTIFSLKNTGM